MSGRQLADLARQHRPDMQVLSVTGYAEQVTGDGEVLGSGMPMATKPFTLDALAFKIREPGAKTLTSAVRLRWPAPRRRG